MKNTRILLLYGFLLWLIPFVIAIGIFTVRESNRPLFESIMPVVLCLGAVVLSIAYFTRVENDLVRAGLIAGTVWLVMSVSLDLLLFMWGPMRMTLGAYMADIGLTYLIFPIVTTGMGWVLERRLSPSEPRKPQQTLQSA